MAYRSYDGYVYVFCSTVCVQRLVSLLFILIAVASDSCLLCEVVPCVACVCTENRINKR